jgi:hypothetical protein
MISVVLTLIISRPPSRNGLWGLVVLHFTHEVEAKTRGHGIQGEHHQRITTTGGKNARTIEDFEGHSNTQDREIRRE